MLSSFDTAARQRLAGLLDPHAESGTTMRLDEVQGFMMALLSGPDQVSPHIWLPEVLGEEAVFSEQEQTEIRQLVLDMAADMRAQLAEGKLPELYLYDGEDGLPDVYTWCNAYLYGLDVVETDWFEAVDDENFEDLFYPIMALGGVFDEQEDGAAVLTLSDEELTELESDLPHSLLSIYRYWQVLIHKPKTVRREGEKAGRNDPCPCGSGKKYKACCGRA